MVEWQQVPGNVSRYDIVLPPATDGDHYQFGIASQSPEYGSSGVSWSDCVFHANASKQTYCTQHLPRALIFVKIMLVIVIFSSCFKAVMPEIR